MKEEEKGVSACILRRDRKGKTFTTVDLASGHPIMTMTKYKHKCISSGV